MFIIMLLSFEVGGGQREFVVVVVFLPPSLFFLFLQVPQVLVLLKFMRFLLYSYSEHPKDRHVIFAKTSAHQFVG